MSDPHTDDLLRRNKEFSELLAETDEEGLLAGLFVGGRRNRQMIRLLSATVALVLIFIGAVIFGQYRQHLTQQRQERQQRRIEQIAREATLATSLTAKNAALLRAICLAVGESNANNKALWDKAYSYTPLNQTDEERRRAADFKIFVEKLFAPRDCPEAPVLPPLPNTATPVPKG